MTSVEDIINGWLDENAEQIVRDEIDVENEIENQVEDAIDKAMDDIDVEELVNEKIEEVISLEKFNALVERVKRLETIVAGQESVIRDAHTDIADILVRMPTKRGWFW